MIVHPAELELVPSSLVCTQMANREGEIWKQESIVGSVFEGSVQVRDSQIFPALKGAAFVNAEAELILDEFDPFRTGIRA